MRITLESYNAVVSNERIVMTFAMEYFKIMIFRVQNPSYNFNNHPKLFCYLLF